MLSQQRFAQLDALLNKAGMYTQFLTEQMQSFAADTPGAGSQGEEEEADEEEGDEEEAGEFVSCRQRCIAVSCMWPLSRRLHSRCSSVESMAVERWLSQNYKKAHAVPALCQQIVDSPANYAPQACNLLFCHKLLRVALLSPPPLLLLQARAKASVRRAGRHLPARSARRPPWLRLLPGARPLLQQLQRPMPRLAAWLRSKRCAGGAVGAVAVICMSSCAIQHFCSMDGVGSPLPLLLLCLSLSLSP